MELKLAQLTKTFGDMTAVDAVSCTMHNGVYGLLGVNGAGKTTLMRMICTLMKPTDGVILWNGRDIWSLDAEYRRILGYLPQEFGFYPDFSAEEYLMYIASIKGLSPTVAKRRVAELLHTVNMEHVRKKKMKKFSGGMKRRIGIAQAMLNDPQILILDEPTAGLDPNERIRFRNLISELSEQRLVLLSTHIVSDVEYIATENAIMKEGKLIASGKTEELEKLVDGKVWCAVISAEHLPKYESKTRIINMKSQDNGNILVRYLADEPFIDHSEKASPNLNDVYFWLFPREGQVEKV